MVATSSELESGKAAHTEKATTHHAGLSKASKAIIATVVSVVVAGGIFSAVYFGGGFHLEKEKLEGKWITNFDQDLTITMGNHAEWHSVSTSGLGLKHIQEITATYIIAQNSADDAYNPNKFSKIEYFWNDEDARTGGYYWGFCTTVYDAETAEAAAAFDTSAIYDAVDLANGCNAFSHTMVAPFDGALPIIGSWTDDYGNVLDISADMWTSTAPDSAVSEYAITSFGSLYVLAQNGAANAYNPSKWSKWHFHMLGADSFGFCQVAYDGATDAATLNTAVWSTYDKSDAAAGCNGFAHSIATRNA